MDGDAFPPRSLDALHRAFDGPVPDDTLREALSGEAAPVAIGRALLRLHDRLAAEARLATARRRAAVRPPHCRDDVWLNRLVATLAHHRNAATRLRLQRKANSQ